MMGESTAVQRAGSKLDPFHAAANFPDKDEYGTLILDHVGKIISCGAPAEKIFGASRDRLAGRWISEFITGLVRDGSSPSYCARYLAYLCTNGEWRKFKAADADGREFSVELNLARMVTDGREILVLNVRRSEDHAGSGFPA